jgi:hypothetical protein
MKGHKRLIINEILDSNLLADENHLKLLSEHWRRKLFSGEDKKHSKRGYEKEVEADHE